jgi:predicted dehydrogenase
MIKAALEAGLHVLSETPLTLESATAVERGDRVAI